MNYREFPNGSTVHLRTEARQGQGPSEGYYSGTDTPATGTRGVRGEEESSASETPPRLLPTPVDAWHCGTPFLNETINGDPWKEIHDLVDKFDEDMCRAWLDELDKLLIFAGLFSAAVTAFATTTYQSLGRDPNSSKEYILSQILAIQLSTLNNNGSLNVPDLALTPQPPYTAPATAIRVNILLFTSLSLSLTVVLIGILCIQWLREYLRDAALPHKAAISLRQMRWDALHAWKVPQILTALPLLLQIAFILFFTGIIELLCALNTMATIPVTCIMGTTLLFMAATTVLPALQNAFHPAFHFAKLHQCPYKSPQSWVFYQFTLLLTQFFNFVSLKTAKPIVYDKDWTAFDMRWRAWRAGHGHSSGGETHSTTADIDMSRAMDWVSRQYGHKMDIYERLHHCFAELGIGTVLGALRVSTAAGAGTAGSNGESGPARAGALTYLVNATLGTQFDVADLDRGGGGRGGGEKIQVLPTLRLGPGGARNVENVLREVASTMFLNVHFRSHSNFEPFARRLWVERQVRVLNDAYEVLGSRAYIDLVGRVQLDKSISVPSLLQVLHTTEHLLTNHPNTLTLPALRRIWDLILTTYTTSHPSTSPPPLHQAVFALFAALETWLAHSALYDRRTRVRECAGQAGRMRARLCEQVKRAWFVSSAGERGSYGSLVRLLGRLDGFVREMGGVEGLGVRVWVGEGQGQEDGDGQEGEGRVVGEEYWRLLMHYFGCGACNAAGNGATVGAAARCVGFGW